MLLLYPATLAFSLSKFLLFYVLTTRDVSTYVGIAAAGAGLHAAHFVTYATLSRSGLQLPVGAFLPAPEALSATDMVLYAAPAAVGAWRSSVDVLECASDFAKTLKVVVSRTVDAIQQQWDYLDILVHTRPVVTLSSERTYFLDETQWSYYNESSILAPIPLHILYDYPILPPILAPPLPFTGSSDICPLPVLGVCTIDGYVPDPVVTVALAARPGLELHRLTIEPLETPRPESPVHEPFADLEGVAVGFHSPIQPTIIHVRSCLIGLLVVCCCIYCCYICIRLTLRLTVRLARFMYHWVCALCTSVWGLTIRLGIVSRPIESIEVTSENICGAGANNNSAAKTVAPETPLVKVEEHAPVEERAPVHERAPVEEPVLVEEPTLVEEPAPAEVPHKRNKNKKKKKKKAGKGSKVDPPSTTSTLSPVPMSSTNTNDVEDEGGKWTTVTRTRRMGRTLSPAPAGRAKSKSEGERGRQ
ncbi:hypothetical protein FRC06_001838 [Ceratobasidium sp. 370]|nr:hypothetical protein FRC06_001838 [Ceratobasidium sp. 370]